MANNVDELTVAITADTSDFQAALATLGKQSDSFASSITRAFKQAVTGGKDFGSVLSTLALQIAGLALTKALQPLTSSIGNGISSLFSAFGLAKGGVVAGGRIQKFASGGVVSSPTLFPLATGLGLMGEAGPEAVLPLSRGSDGRLGVASGGGGGATVVNFQITTPDAASFQKSEAQVTAMLARAVGRGRRSL
jgi:lambda family phage tail tape measure protein